MRIGSIRVARPFVPVSTYTPQSVPGPLAVVNRPPRILVVKRRMGSSTSMPMIEL